MADIKKTKSQKSTAAGPVADSVADAAIVSETNESHAEGELVEVTVGVDSPEEAEPVQPEQPEEREQWNKKMDYFLTLVGYAVGFGNIWRFPYLLHSNGGIAFLVPYTIMLLAAGLPLFFLELAIGQRLKKGALACWFQISPFLGGLGLAMGITCFSVVLYYNTLVAYVISYFVDAFRETLAWTSCETASGFDDVLGRECDITKQPSKFYWYRRTLDISDAIEEPGNFNWYMALYLLIAWFLVYIILVNGIKTSGKVVYFTSLFPYFTLACFFIGNFFIEGWMNGYTILLKPDWTVLWDPQVWLTAGTQVFFSLGLAYGILIIFASYLPSKNDCYKDAIYVSTINCLTSLVAAIVIFPILGSQGTRRFAECEANQKSGMNSFMGICDLEQEVRNSGSGTGLVFIAFAEAALHLPCPQFWCSLFFLMLLTLGLDSAFGTCEGAIAAFVDLKLVTWPRWVVTTVICGSLFLFSLIFAAGWGSYIQVLLDQFVANWTVLIIAFFELIGVSWVYGLAQFSYDIKLMTGTKPNWYMIICWKYISPLLILAILIGSIVGQFKEGLQYDRYDKTTGDKKTTPYPRHILAVGHILWLFAVSWVPIQAILAYFGYSLIKAEAPAFFPEEELRNELQMTEEDDLGQFDPVDRLVMGKSIDDFIAKRTKSETFEDMDSLVPAMEAIDAQPALDEPKKSTTESTGVKTDSSG